MAQGARGCRSGSLDKALRAERHGGDLELPPFRAGPLTSRVQSAVPVPRVALDRIKRLSTSRYRSQGYFCAGRYARPSDVFYAASAAPQGALVGAARVQPDRRRHRDNIARTSLEVRETAKRARHKPWSSSFNARLYLSPSAPSSQSMGSRCAAMYLLRAKYLGSA